MTDEQKRDEKVAARSKQAAQAAWRSEAGLTLEEVQGLPGEVAGVIEGIAAFRRAAHAGRVRATLVKGGALVRLLDAVGQDVPPGHPEFDAAAAAARTLAEEGGVVLSVVGSVLCVGKGSEKAVGRRVVVEVAASDAEPAPVEEVAVEEPVEEKPARARRGR